jgi:hypothetical protein
MNLPAKSKIALGVIGSLVAGALGSGLWSWMFEPGLSRLGKGILNLVTFGTSSLKDNVYSTAAQGLHEVPSLHVHLFLITIIVALPVSFSFLALFLLRQKSSTAARRRVISTGRLRQLILFYVFFVCVSGSWLFVTFLLNNQANLTVTHFQQSLHICRPYMSPDEYIRFESDFAQMRKRDDYLRLSGSLAAIARKNNQTLPKFEPW